MCLLLFHKRRNRVNLYNIFVYITNIMIIIHYVFIFLLKMQLIFSSISRRLVFLEVFLDYCFDVNMNLLAYFLGSVRNIYMYFLI